MSHTILYLGDTELTGAAAYLAGLMTHWEWEFDYVASDKTVSSTHLQKSYELIVLSDYPASRMNDEIHSWLLHQVQTGSGLLMCGGWESYQGLGGDWHGTPTAAALPVEIDDSDDRFNCDAPLVVAKVQDHPIVRGLPWAERPPLIGGLNRVTSKPAAKTIVEAHLFSVVQSSQEFQFRFQQPYPLLVVGNYGMGRTTALTTDLAPHWIWPMVDWGMPRVTAQAPGSNEVEVGGLYCQFLNQLLSWTGSWLAP